MPVVVNLARILDERRVSLTELSERVDLTLTNLSILKTGKAKAIRFSTLGALCKELGCQPGDILAFETDEADDAAPRPEPPAKRPIWRRG